MPSETLLKAYGLIAQSPDLFGTVEEMHRHFTGEELRNVSLDRAPGVVLRWLHCYGDLELWQEAFHDRPAPTDIEQVLALADQLEALGIEAEGERPCHECEYRKRCL